LIGALTPQANTTVEPEFNILWPPGYTMINARLTSKRDTIEARLVDYWNTIELTLNQFANAPIDAYAFGCTGTSYLVGADQEDDVVHRIEIARGVPFITSARAVTDALNALSAKRIGLVSPYPPGLTEASIGYWQSRDFEIVETSSAFNQESGFHPIYSLAAASAQDALSQLKKEGVEAIVMLGTGMPTLQPIADVAGSGGPPAVSCMLCLAWRTVLAIQGTVPTRASILEWVSGAGWAARLAARRLTTA
jgi:maleate cis-trans isomerase